MVYDFYIWRLVDGFPQYDEKTINVESREEAMRLKQRFKAQKDVISCTFKKIR